MVSKLSQFCHIVIYCIEHYSKDTTVFTVFVANQMKNHRKVFQLEKLIDKYLPEKELLNEIKSWKTIFNHHI